MMKAMFLALVLVLTGCAAPVQRTESTDSGRPEVQINGVDLDTVRAKLIERTMAAGYTLDTDTPTRLVVSKEMQGMREALMRMSISNSHSTPVREEVAMTLVKNPQGVRVYAQLTATSTMPLGQVVRKDMSQNNDGFNTIQASLVRLRDSLQKVSTP